MILYNMPCTCTCIGKVFDILGYSNYITYLVDGEWVIRVDLTSCRIRYVACISVWIWHLGVVGLIVFI